MTSCVSSLGLCKSEGRSVRRFVARSGRRTPGARLVSRATRLAAAALLCTGVTAEAQSIAFDPNIKPTFAKEPVAEAPVPQQAPPATRPWPPRYAERRFDENWQPLAWGQPHAGARDIFDKIKAIPLNDSGSTWIGFGGSVRGRLAYQSTVTFGGPFDFEPTMWTGRLRGHTDFHAGKFRAFGEYIYSYSSIEALVDTFNAPSARLGFDAPNTEGDVLNLFGEYQTGISRGWQASVWGGRRELLMGNQRIISPGNWLLNRHTFDGAGATVHNNKHRFEGFVTRPRVPVPDRFTRRDDDTVLSGVFYTRGFQRRGGEQNIRFEPYLLNIVRKDVTLVQGTADENRWTMGALMQGDIGPTGLDFEAEGMYQNGRYETPFDRGIINAYAWVTKVGYRFRNVRLVPRPSVSLEYSSGDSNPNDTSLGTFDPLYPLAWSFYGFHAAFDRKNFVAGGLHLEGAYKRTYFRTSYFPIMWRAQVNDGVYNSFNEIARRPDPQSRGAGFVDLQNASRNIGQQIDFGFFYQATHHLQFYATYLHFFAGPFYTETATAEKRPMNGVMLLTEYAF